MSLAYRQYYCSAYGYYYRLLLSVAMIPYAVIRACFICVLLSFILLNVIVLRPQNVIFPIKLLLKELLNKKSKNTLLCTDIHSEVVRTKLRAQNAKTPIRAD